MLKTLKSIFMYTYRLAAKNAYFCIITFAEAKYFSEYSGML